MGGDIDQIIIDCYDEIVTYIDSNYDRYQHLMNVCVDFVPYGSTEVMMQAVELTDEALMQAAQDMWEAELINYNHGRYTVN